MICRLLLLSLAAVSCGCTQLSLFTLASRNKFVTASDRNPVVEVLCLWEPAEGNDLNGLPCRGFAGQVLFFTPGSAQSARIDGDIRIYVFDDVGDEDERSRPLRQFDFDSGSWNALMHGSDLGASYQLFVPYTRPGQFQANCTLRVRYTPKDGGTPVYSKMAPVFLTGRPREAAVSASLPEGYSVPSPVGAPARTESALRAEPPQPRPDFQMPTVQSQQLQQHLSALQAAAAASAREAGGEGDTSPAALHVKSPAAPADDESQIERRSYRLSLE